jgi:hypothetical protein
MCSRPRCQPPGEVLPALVSLRKSPHQGREILKGDDAIGRAGSESALGTTQAPL